MIEHKSVQTSRLKTAYYHGGTNGKQKLMLIHGNCSSSVFYLKLMERLENDFEIVAPDLRCFGDSEALFVDATRGLRDWSDDIHELVCALHWESFIICGWSMGGGVAMQYAIDYSEYLDGIILEAPLSPFGFGGTYDKDGKKLMPSGLGSGGGCANVQLVKSLLDGDREFFRTLLKNSYVVQGYAIDAAWEEKLVDGIGSTKVGDGMYPGDFSETRPGRALVQAQKVFVIQWRRIIAIYLHSRILKISAKSHGLEVLGTWLCQITVCAILDSLDFWELFRDGRGWKVFRRSRWCPKCDMCLKSMPITAVYIKSLSWKIQVMDVILTMRKSLHRL